MKEYGKLDILVANAGIVRAGDFLTMSEENWDATIDINLKGWGPIYIYIIEDVMPSHLNSMAKTLTHSRARYKLEFAQVFSSHLNTLHGRW